MFFDRFKVVDENPENWKTMRVLPDGTTTFTLYNLIPDTEYEFSVLSRNRLGDGMFSKVMKGKTKGRLHCLLSLWLRFHHFFVQ
jgi:hypothetical protein